MDKESFQQVYGNGTKLFELAWFKKELPSESNRGQVMVVSAYLEDLVERALRVFLPNSDAKKSLLDGAMAPISKFAAKTSLAHCLGLLTQQEYNNLTIVRKIRNKFAHKVHISFETPDVAALVANLDFALAQLDTNPITKPIEPHYRFQLATSALLSALHDRSDRIEKQ